MELLYFGKAETDDNDTIKDMEDGKNKYEYMKLVNC